MTIDSIAMQAETGAVLFLGIILTILICAIFFAIQRRSISKLSNRVGPEIQSNMKEMHLNMADLTKEFNIIKEKIPHSEMVKMMGEKIEVLNASFDRLNTDTTDRINTLKNTTSIELQDTRENMMKAALEQLLQQTNEHLENNSVSKTDFEHLKKRIERMIGGDEAEDRMRILSNIFDSTNIRTINWQCKLIKLLKGGLAPDAEEDLLASESIPRSSYEKFLSRLQSVGLAESRKIKAYYLIPEGEWIYSYVDNPDWLKNRLESTVTREDDYQRFIRDNLHLVEPGLKLVSREYKLPTGIIDFICRDVNGIDVGLELKYPEAGTSVKRQILSYANDYREQSRDARYMVIAPIIPDNLKQILSNDGIEYKEIAFGESNGTQADDSSQETGSPL